MGGFGKNISIALVLLAITSIGCARMFTRKDNSKPIDPVRPIPTEPIPQTAKPDQSTQVIQSKQEIEAPKDPMVSPPKPTILAGAVPPLPNGDPTIENARLPETDTVSPIEPVSLDEDRKPLRERLEERRKAREERREQRQTPPEDERKFPEQSNLPPLPPPNQSEPVKPPEAATPKPEPANDLQSVRKLLDSSLKRWGDITDYEAHLVKKEVVGGKQLPSEEITFQFRKEPYSVYMQVIGENGHGRELLYVKGQSDGKMHVVTGKGDNRFVGAGYKTELDPDSRTATAKSRYKIYEAGFGRTLNNLNNYLQAAEAGKPGPKIKMLGEVKRPEYEYALTAVEEQLRAGDEPLMPRGGKRTIYFDPKNDSPGRGMPVLVVTTDHDGTEVEYYCFDKIKVPSGLSDADWTPARLGRRK